MKKRVLDVGNCPPDHAAIRHLIQTNFDAEVLQAHNAADTLAILSKQPIDLVLVNRKLDQDYSDGLRIIEQLKKSPETESVPVMMVTNYADHQELAVAAGAAPGFGKLSLHEETTRTRLAEYLS